MANIDDFKANLIGGGARANQYRVTITPPSGIAIGLDVSRTSFLCTAAALPGATLGTFDVPFRGRIITIAGDRPPFPDWTTTFYNDTDFMIRNAMERWNNGINDFANNTGVTSPADYQTDLTIFGKDEFNNNRIKFTYTKAFPTTVEAINYSYTDADEITSGFTFVYSQLHTEVISF